MPNRHCKTFFASSATSAGATSKNSAGNQFTLEFSPQISIPENAKNIFVSVPSASIWNTTLNISTTLANNTFTFTDDNGNNTKYSITLPNGRYSVTSLSEAINRLASVAAPTSANIFEVQGDGASQKCVLYVKASGWKVNFTSTGSVRTLLGFNTQTIPASALTTVPIYTYGDTVANFGDLSSFLISSTLTSGSEVWLGNRKANCLYTGLIEVAPGSLNSHQPYNPPKIQSAHLAGANLSSIGFTLSDQNGLELDTNSEDWDCRVIIEYET